MARAPQLLLLALAACAPPGPALSTPPPFDAELGASLQQALDDGRLEIGAQGGTAAVYLPDEGLWLGASGLADRDNDLAAVPSDPFKIASITKIYTAIVVLELVEEGALGLDDPVVDWLAWAPHADRYTLRHLLTHTSGLGDHVDDPAYLGALGDTWTPQTIAAVIEDEALLFEPGSAYSYSNTGYHLLGAVVEQASGTDWDQQVVDRILVPHELDRTWVPGVQQPPPLARGYFGAHPSAADVTDTIHHSAEGAGGNMVSDVAGLNDLGRLLLAEGAVSSDFVRTTLHERPLLDGVLSGYGHGLDLTPYEGLELTGHSGSTVGYQSRLHVNEPSGIVVAVLVNDFLSEADTIDRRLWDVLLGDRRL